MTALKPISNLRVRGVPSERYPLNEFCASPMSDAGTKADDAHHAFPRSQIGNDSWFVEITEDDGQIALPIPHVVGLSREQHERVERHDAWIRYEDGVWNWYEAITRAEVEAMGEEFGQYGQTHSLWRLVGPLNPQPGSRESKPRRKKFKGEAKRQRKTISIRVPADEAENGAAVYDELLEQAQEKLKEIQGLDYLPTPYIVLIAALYELVTG